MDVNALAKMFVITVQMTFPPIPPSAQDHGIGMHPELDDGTHLCVSMYCCNLKDCRPLASGSVYITPKGYSVPLPDGGREIVPFNGKQIRQPSRAECGPGSEFQQTDWACYHQIAGKWQVRCLYPKPRGF